MEKNKILRKIKDFIEKNNLKFLAKSDRFGRPIIQIFYRGEFLTTVEDITSKDLNYLIKDDHYFYFEKDKRNIYLKICDIVDKYDDIVMVFVHDKDKINPLIVIEDKLYDDVSLIVNLNDMKTFFEFDEFTINNGEHIKNILDNLTKIQNKINEILKKEK